MDPDELDDLVMDLADEIEDMGFDSEDLDDLIYGFYMDLASSINNQGPWEQLRVLIDEGGWTRDEILSTLLEDE